MFVAQINENINERKGYINQKVASFNLKATQMSSREMETSKGKKPERWGREQTLSLKVIEGNEKQGKHI